MCETRLAALFFLMRFRKREIRRVAYYKIVFFARDDLTSGLEQQKEGNHDQAITEFTEVIQKHETEVQEFLKKWDEYEKISVFERAEKGIEAPAVDAGLARAYYLRGISYAAVQNNEEAMKDQSVAIKVDPKLGGAYYQRGKLHWILGNKFEGCSDLGAARSLGDSLAKEMYDEKFCWNEALSYYKDTQSKFKLNLYEDCLATIAKAIRISPDSTAFLALRGRCYLGMGKLDLAFIDFDRTIASSQTNIDAYYGRGMAFLNKRKFQEAFDDLDKAIRLNERFVDAYMYRAAACEGMNKVQSALYDYEQVQRLKPNDPVAFYKSGLLKNENGDPAGACADFKRAAALGHTEAADYAKGCKK